MYALIAYRGFESLPLCKRKLATKDAGFSFFNVSTLTTGIYNSWLAYDDLNTANQLSFILLTLILSLFLIENYSRGGAKYHQNSNAGFRKIPKIDLKGKKSLFPIIFCSLSFFATTSFPTVLNEV